MSGVNYFFALTTTVSPYQRQLLPNSSAERSDRPSSPTILVERKIGFAAVGKWKPGFGFPLFHPPRRQSCGNVGISPFLRDFQGGVETVGSLGLAFHGFHAAAISTALFLPVLRCPLHSLSA